MKSLLALICGLGLCLAVHAADRNRQQLDALLAAGEPPDGVVFEIIVWEDHSWDWAAPLLADSIAALQARFPGLEVALISHGAELFELTHAAGLAESPALRQLAALSDAGLEVHVCGEYAQWKRLEAKDFLPFVDVATSGSAQLEDYVKLGFVPFRLEAPHGAD